MALPRIPSHEEYLQHLRQYIFSSPYALSSLRAQEDLLHFFYCCNLTPAIAFLCKLYSPLGRTAYDPTAMLRTFLLITQVPCKSLHHLTNFLAGNPLYAVLCGFDPELIPAPQTFRDFLDRLAALRKSLKADRVRRAKKSRKQRKNSSRPGRLERFLQRLVNGKRIPLTAAVEAIDELLATFAGHSIHAGYLGDPQKLRVAGDGTPFPLHANGKGKKTCDCPPGSSCDHPRRFSSPDANWGYDHSRDRFFYGGFLYEYTAKGPGGEVPLYLSVGQASVHDSVPGFLDLYGLVHLYPDCHVDLADLDSAHDNHATYRLGRLLNVRLVIDLNLGRAKHNQVVNSELQLDQSGNPVCRAGHSMVRRGRIGRHIRFDCPATRKRRRIECREDCFGRCRCLHQDADLRFLTDPPRGSREWHQAFNDRTCTERSHDMKKNDFRLKDSRVRSLRRLFPLYVIAACAQHVRLWTKHEGFSLEQFLNPQAA